MSYRNNKFGVTGNCGRPSTDSLRLAQGKQGRPWFDWLTIKEWGLTPLVH